MRPFRIIINTGRDVVACVSARRLKFETVLSTFDVTPKVPRHPSFYYLPSLFFLGCRLSRVACGGPLELASVPLCFVSIRFGSSLPLWHRGCSIVS